MHTEVHGGFCCCLFVVALSELAAEVKILCETLCLLGVLCVTKGIQPSDYRKKTIVLQVTQGGIYQLGGLCVTNNHKASITFCTSVSPLKDAFSLPSL